MKKATCFSVFAGAALFMAACAPVQPAAPAPATAMPTAEATAVAVEPAEEMEAGTIVDIAVSNPDFSTLVTAVTEAGLVEVLADPNQ